MDCSILLGDGKLDQANGGAIREALYKYEFAKVLALGGEDTISTESKFQELLIACTQIDRDY